MKKILINHLVTSEKVLKPHILASEILKNRETDILLSIDHEGWDLVANGTERLVKEICDYNRIDYKKIKFESSNRNPNLTYFDHIRSVFYLGTKIKYPEDMPNIKNNKYGLFIARPTNERLHAFLKHIEWEHSKSGIATFHFNPLSQNELESDYIDFLVHYNNDWKKLLKILPYSDFGDYLDKQIDLNQRPSPVESISDINFWSETYKKISTEIVCETVLHNESFFITEKIIRPILYKRLFLTISSINYEKRLKELGFDIFDDIIDKTYDNKSYYDRVNHVYGSLECMINNFEKIKNSTHINQRLEKNKQQMIEYINDQAKLIRDTKNE